MGSKSKKRQREDPLASPEALEGFGESSSAPSAKKARLARHSTRGERDAVMSGALPDDEPPVEKTENKGKKARKERKAKRKAEDEARAAAAAGGAKEERVNGDVKEGAVNGEGSHLALEHGHLQLDGADDTEDEKKKKKKEKKAKKEAKVQTEGDEARNEKKDKKERKEKKAKARAETAAAAADVKEEIPAQTSTSQQPDEADYIKFDDDDDNAYGKGKKSRFIAFVGNLPFTATKEDIERHFSSLSPFTVRLLHDKKNRTKSRGIAFIEFDRFDHMRTCLTKFHHSNFNDGKSDVRVINVELTAGGGGRGQNRKEKIQMKNAKLNEERIRRMQNEEAEKIEKEKKKKAQAGAPEQTQEEREEEQIHPSRRARVPHRQGQGGQRW